MAGCGTAQHPTRGAEVRGRAAFKQTPIFFAVSDGCCLQADGDVVPIGLIKNEWGGSLIEAWVPDRSSATGETYCTGRKNRTGRTPGKLFNSMIMPVSNATIRGWLWYQGEQDGGAAGSYLNKSGYACMLPALDDSWRRAFREGSSTDPNFPIGVVSLHGWCGEEEAACSLNPATRTDQTAEIRWAQTADWGFLPNPRLPHTFVAMAYDQPDPRNGSHCYWNATSNECDRSVAYPHTCLPDREICPPPGGMMGGNIHPRNKLLLGDRIARAAKAMEYEDDSVGFTGPVVVGCTVSGGKVTFHFNETLLRGEGLLVKVRRGFELRTVATGNWSFVPISSNLGLQAAPSVVIDAPGAIDAVRYNWLDNVACPDAYCDYTKPLVNQSCANGGSAHHRHDTIKNFWWCFNPMETIALYTATSMLPAPPFTLDVADGKCVMPAGVNR
jgi:sialate O-acetylesterase